MTEILNRISRLLRTHVPDEWTSAHVEIEFERDGTWSSMTGGWKPWPEDGVPDEWSEFSDEAIPLLSELWRDQDSAAEPWTRAVITFHPDGSIEPVFSQSETILYDERAAAARKVRENTFSGYGDLDDEMIAPGFGGAFGLPSWPCRPGWRVLRRGGHVMLLSEGLSDPFFPDEDDEERRVGPGFGIEVFAETPDEILPKSFETVDVQHTWLFSAIFDVCNTVADREGINDLLDQHQGAISLEVSGDEFPAELRNKAGRVGVLLGVPAPGLPDAIELPEGTARIVAVTLLTRNELEYAIDHGDEGRREIRDRLIETSNHHLSSTRRRSVVP